MKKTRKLSKAKAILWAGFIAKYREWLEAIQKQYNVRTKGKAALMMGRWAQEGVI